MKFLSAIYLKYIKRYLSSTWSFTDSLQSRDTMAYADMLLRDIDAAWGWQCISAEKVRRSGYENTLHRNKDGVWLLTFCAKQSSCLKLRNGTCTVIVWARSVKTPKQGLGFLKDACHVIGSTEECLEKLCFRYSLRWKVFRQLLKERRVWKGVKGAKSKVNWRILFNS